MWFKSVNDALSRRKEPVCHASGPVRSTRLSHALEIGVSLLRGVSDNPRATGTAASRVWRAQRKPRRWTQFIRRSRRPVAAAVNMGCVACGDPVRLGGGVAGGRGAVLKDLAKGEGVLSQSDGLSRVSGESRSCVGERAWKAVGRNP